MRADEIRTICESVLLEGPETPQDAVRSIRRMALTITIKELRSKGDAYLRTAERMENQLSVIEDESRQAIEADENRF